MTGGNGQRHGVPATIVAMAMLFAAHNALAEAPAKEPVAGAAAIPVTDHRQLIALPEASRALMRQEMLDHLTTLTQIFAALAEGDLAQAAEVAETRMGESSMGKYAATGMGPGRFMPNEMRMIGWDMHAAASEFARVVKKGDARAAQASLQKLTSTCVACHLSYRTR